MNTTTTLTHLIRSRKCLRYTPHHHRGPLLNKTHAVNDPDLQIRHCATTTTVCGAAVRVEELDEVLGADGGPVYNCRPCSDPAPVNCKFCRKALGL